MIDDEVSFVLQHFQPGPVFGGSQADVVESKPRRKRGFSSLKYVGGAVTVSYLADCVLLFKFEVSSVKPYLVTCVGFGNNSLQLKKKLYKICTDLSSSTTSDKNATSLFAVVSSLLLSLNNLRVCKDSTDMEKSSILSRIIFQSTPSCRRIWDLELLLLRCAAAGNQRDIFCSPVPEEFRGDGWLAERVLAATENININELCSGKRILHQQEQELLGFLFSLPRAEQGTLRTISRTRNRSNRRIELCLDMESTIGENSPRFAHLAKLHGVTTAFHGTKIGSIWSILNCGLRNMSETKYIHNGAMMGSGVYLSDSYKVASFFAANNSSSSGSFQLSWQHLSLLRLLDLSSPDVFDGQVISCFPVFEAQIILPPQKKSDEKDCTRRDGKYFVVPNNRDIRITKLHLTFELVKEKSFSPFLLVIFIFAGVIYLYCSLES